MNALNRRAARVAGVAIPLLQIGREVCVGRWPDSLLRVPIAVDAYVMGFSTGILYRSFFEQVADPTRHAGFHVLVLAVKGVLLVGVVAGLVGAVITRPGFRSQ